jgi:crotonobetainyl-CoA:carnitine CoA-transferase CaiB-like acyl-CoA transferase
MRPLAGTRVLDLTSNVSGPFVTMVLARLGADVVKVERPPFGDDARQFPPMAGGESLIFGWCNSGKRSVGLDLARPEGRDAARRLAAGCDVMIHSFKPGVVDRLGVSEADVRAWGLDLLYCDVSAFGHGVGGRDLKGYDPIVQAFSGIMDMTGYEDGPPARCAPSIVDLTNGMWMAIGILAALMARRGGDPVASVQSALVDSALALVPWQATVALETGERPQRRGASHELGAPYDLFATADRPLFLTAANQSLWRKLLAVLAVEHLLDDPRFETALSRAAHAPALKEALEVPLRTRPAESWLAELTAAGIPASLVLGLDEAVRTPVAEERKWFEEVGGQNLVRLPVLADGAPLDRPDPAPRLGAHTVAVLEAAGLATEDITALLDSGVAMAGTDADEAAP